MITIPGRAGRRRPRRASMAATVVVVAASIAGFPALSVSRAGAATPSPQLALVSTGIAGPAAGWSLTGPQAISGDGRYVAFSSSADNLVPGDTNRAFDVFVRDRKTGTTTRVSTGTGGEQGAGDSSAASISGDGRHVAFVTWATNLAGGAPTPAVVVKDLDSGRLENVSRCPRLPRAAPQLRRPGPTASIRPRPGAYAPRGLDVVFIGATTSTANAVSAGTGAEPYGLFPSSIYTPVTFRVGALFQGQPVETIQVLIRGGTLPPPTPAATNGNTQVGAGQATSLWVEDTPTFGSPGWNLVLAHRNADGTFVATGCTDSGPIGDAEAAVLAQTVPRAVVFDPTLRGALAGTGAPSGVLAVAGLALCALGATLSLLHHHPRSRTPQTSHPPV